MVALNLCEVPIPTLESSIATGIFFSAFSAVDASLIIYQQLLNNQKAFFKNKEGKITNHITGLFYKIMNYISLNIELIFVFDGKPPDNKENCLQERREKSKKLKELSEKAESEEDKTKYEKMYRKDDKYDIVIPIHHNSFNPKKNKRSAIFIHLTKNYSKTLGCVALKKKDMLVLMKIINDKTKIKII